MYIEDPETIYACFRCGVVLGDVENDGDFSRCGHCKKHSIVNIIQALDIINQFYEAGYLKLDGDLEELEFGEEFPEDPNFEDGEDND
jgi:DNA-directed RNA polymerase subunit RPC12/RpoP